MNAYQIYAYDKDGDRLDIITEIPLHTVVDAELPKQLLEDVSKLVKSERLKTSAGQPYDWVELHFNNKRIKII